MTTSFVMTAIGADRPGIVESISELAQRFGANWAGSRMASLAGQFAGMVHLEVPEANAEKLEAALLQLETAGLRVVVVRSGSASRPRARRRMRLDLVGHDRPGIVHELSESLASRGVSIDELSTQVTGAAMAGGHLFRVKAVLAVPSSLSDGDLRKALEALANEMMVDLEFRDPAGS